MIKKVHVVFKTHLDIGFTDLAKNVVDQYINHFIPKAIDLAEELYDKGEREQFIWTVGSWLIDEYLRIGDVQQINRLEKAIQKGLIRWHGLPFTTHTELMSEQLFEYGVSLSKRLDERFHTKTIAAKMTDVPGHTIGMVPILARNNIKFLHIGVNPASYVPDVPDIFRWRAQDGSEVIVGYAKQYGDILKVEGLDEVLYIAHTGDNQGPPSKEAIKEVFDRLQCEYPEATIQASTLDEFTYSVLRIREQLPVIMDEIGDTWIHGVASDPYKVALFKALEKKSKAWQKEGWSKEDSDFDAFHRCLLLVTEHTWGMDHKSYLQEYDKYTRKDFDKARASDEDQKYTRMNESWQEQRNYLYHAIDQLEPTRKAEALKLLAPSNRWRKGINLRTIQPYEVIKIGQFLVQVNPNGALVQLTDEKGNDYIQDQAIGSLTYEVFDETDYNYWLKNYSQNMSVNWDWAKPDFSKPQLEYNNCKVKKGRYVPFVKRMYRESNQGKEQIYVELGMNPVLYRENGAPQDMMIVYSFDRNQAVVEIEVVWMNKPANRLPEAIWFAVCPQIKNPNHLRVNKLGSEVNIQEVVYGGNRNMHCINEEIVYYGIDYQFKVTSYDAPVVCIGEPKILRFDQQIADGSKGIHFNLANNIWGTNFPMYSEGDMRFRFKFEIIK
ncbi:MAG: DUF5054 domain-containing protein [Cellulosilyticaceae bacterium]